MISLFQLFLVYLICYSQRFQEFSIKQPVEVHGDYTPTSAAEIFEWQISKVEPAKAAAYREGHFLLINAWRNLNPQPVEHDTLAVCDLDGKMMSVVFFLFARYLEDSWPTSLLYIKEGLPQYTWNLICSPRRCPKCRRMAASSASRWWRRRSRCTPRCKTALERGKLHGTGARTHGLGWIECLNWMKFRFWKRETRRLLRFTVYHLYSP